MGDNNIRGRGNVPDQTGRVAIVTFANTGLGFETAGALEAHGAVAPLNLASLQSVLNAAAEWAGGPQNRLADQQRLA